MLFCTKCGHKVHETAPSCPGCGASRYTAMQATQATSRSVLEQELAQRKQSSYLKELVAIAGFLVIVLIAVINGNDRRSIQHYSGDYEHTDSAAKRSRQHCHEYATGYYNQRARLA